MDFTVTTYENLIHILLCLGYSFKSFADSILDPEEKVVVLRHDVDLLPLNSLRFAKIQADSGIRGSYYFRVVPESYDENVIVKIASLGHEVGYHYEDLGAVVQTTFARASVLKGRKGTRAGGGDWVKRRGGDDFEKELVYSAIESFSENLEKLRKIVPVKTICMHGSPMSSWDSRLLWKYYDYRDFGIIGEPYFDVDFDEMLYLTDTGRRWDGDSVSLRDKVMEHGEGGNGRRGEEEKSNPFADWKVKPFKYRNKPFQNTPVIPEPGTWNLEPGTSKHNPVPGTRHPVPFPKFHSTSDIIKAVKNNQLPDKLMMTFHPQRWTDKPLPWLKELAWQNVKNAGKYFIVKKQSIVSRR